MTHSTSLTLTDEFQRCLDAVLGGSNLFITGKAGTGKSTLLRLIREKYRESVIAVVAPTGVAALNVDGSTLDSFFAFRPSLTADLRAYRPPERLSEIDLLVIDEVSMVIAKKMDMMSRALCRAKSSREPFGGTQVVLIGDLFQLPPVNPHGQEDPEMEGYATPFFFSSHAYQNTPIATVELTHVFRQRDNSFVEILNAVRDGTVTREHLERLNQRIATSPTTHSGESNADAFRVILASRNRVVAEYNEVRLADLPGTPIAYEAVEEGTLDSGKEGKFEDLRLIHLKEGAQVMMLVNQDGYANGTMARVTRLGPDEISVFIPDLNEELEVRPYTWEQLETTRQGGRVEKRVVGRFTQLPVKLAWAVTIHKSQGKTYDSVIYDPAATFEAGMAYVALSRCTSLEGLQLKSPVELKHVKVHPSVVRFHLNAKTPTVPLGEDPVAFIATVATGTDRYRKLVEVAIQRVEKDGSRFFVSTLLQPQRDSSESVLAGINASDLTLAPSVDEARDVLASILDGAIPIGFGLDEFYEQMRFPGERFAEGIGVSLPMPEEPSSLRERSAREITAVAETVFSDLTNTDLRKYRVAPFRVLARDCADGSYLFTRDHLPDPSDYRSRFASPYLLPDANKACLGYTTGWLSGLRTQPIPPDSKAVTGPLLRDAPAAALGATLAQKACADKIVDGEESEFLRNFEAFFECNVGVSAAGDFRAPFRIEEGMLVYLSGGPGPSGSRVEGLKKPAMRKLCAGSGLRFSKTFLERDGVELLAVAGLSNVDGGSYQKAVRWKIDICSWEELLDWVDGKSK
jgi:ATP-dependent DNA helicase PIF1